MVSDRVKLRLHLMLSVIGFVCIAARVWNVVIEPASGRAWFELVGIIILTIGCFDSYLGYRKKLKQVN